MRQWLFELRRRLSGWHPFEREFDMAVSDRERGTSYLAGGGRAFAAPFAGEAGESPELELIAKALVAIYNSSGGTNNVEFMFMDAESGVPFTVTLTPFGGKSPAQINSVLRMALRAVIARPYRGAEIARDVVRRFGYKEE